MTLVILAIDPGISTGFASSNGTSGAVNLGPRPKGLATPAWHGLLAMRFDDLVDAQLSHTGAGVLLVERMLTHGSSAHVLLGLRMVALLRGKLRGVAVEEVWTSQWRPFARDLSWWRKDDELDARAMLAWWSTMRLPLMTT